MATYCGVDFHARQQTVMWCDTRDGEIHEHRLSHLSPDLVRKFYAQFTGEVIVGLEASGYSSWFETMLHELGHQVWVGDAFAIRQRARSRQKTDRRDAELLLDLLLKDEFPRIHRLPPDSLEVLRQLRYRHRLVQLRTKAHNALQTLALGAGASLKGRLQTKAGRAQLNQLGLSPALSRQRQEWLDLITALNERIARVEGELVQVAVADERVGRLRTHPGIGLLTGLALVHTLSPVSRFATSRRVTAFVGLDPREYSSGEKQRFGRISKHGPRLLRFLLVEAANSAVRGDEQLRKLYHRLLHRREKARAKVAVARHLLTRAYIMLRDGIDYAEFLRRGVAARSARTVHRPEVPVTLIERPASGQ